MSKSKFSAEQLAAIQQYGYRRQCLGHTLDDLTVAKRRIDTAEGYERLQHAMQAVAAAQECKDAAQETCLQLGVEFSKYSHLPRLRETL